MLLAVCAAGQVGAAPAPAPGDLTLPFARAQLPEVAALVAEAPPWTLPFAPAPRIATASGSAAAGAAPAPADGVAKIRGFQTVGDNPLGSAETTQVLAPFLRKEISLAILREATAALEKALRDRGHGLHRVALPAQEVGEVVRLEIVKFTVAKVQIEGNSRYSDANVRRALPELRENESPNFRVLAVQTAIANENPNKQLQVGLKESDLPDQIEAAISVRENSPWSFGVNLSNAGTDSSGRDRLTITAGHSNIFDRDHQVLAAYTTSLERLSDVKQLGVSYRVPLYQLGAVLAGTYTRSDVVGKFGAFTSTGAGHTLGVSSTWYLPPDGGRRSYITAAIDDKAFEAAVINEVPIGTDRRSRPLTVGYVARADSDEASWSYNVDLSVNTGGGAHNDLQAYRTEDPRISRHRWKALRAGASFAAPLASDWTWSARGQVQYSPDVLISGEQFGLGGLGSVRGTRTDRPITGDNGALISLELTTPPLVGGLRAVGFLDGGWLGNNDAAAPNKPSSDRLLSAGIGLRWVADPFAVSLDYGRLLTGSRVPAAVNSAAPRRGDDRLYLNLSGRF